MLNDCDDNETKHQAQDWKLDLQRIWLHQKIVISNNGTLLSQLHQWHFMPASEKN